MRTFKTLKLIVRTCENKNLTTNQSFVLSGEFFFFFFFFFFTGWSPPSLQMGDTALEANCRPARS
jgi:hypothetical protein